tara:strand:- start:22077 stop:22673 length:597 start_codon:yes stop_codon:yes gene_type:complete
MKSLLPLLILIISFDASSAYRPTVEHWSQGYGGALMMGEMFPVFNDESYTSSSSPDQFQQPLVIKGLQVEKVVDGDTVYGLLGEKTYKIRLAEIDAPERDQPFGRQSKVFLRKLLVGGEFNAHISSEDQYGRYIAKLYSNGVDVNRKMVSEGMAWVYDYYVIDKTLYLNQEDAQKLKKGIWSKRHPAPPWEWRKAKRR